MVPDTAEDESIQPWRMSEIVQESGIHATLLVGRKSDIEGIWGIVNTMGDVLAREGIRIETAS